jgi:hypothetical protein
VKDGCSSGSCISSWDSKILSHIAQEAATHLYDNPVDSMSYATAWRQ